MGTHEELYKQTYEMLKRLSQTNIDINDFSLMCWHCGFSIADFKEVTNK